VTDGLFIVASGVFLLLWLRGLFRRAAGGDAAAAAWKKKWGRLTLGFGVMLVLVGGYFALFGPRGAVTRVRGEDEWAVGARGGVARVGRHLEVPMGAEWRAIDAGDKADLALAHAATGAVATWRVQTCAKSKSLAELFETQLAAQGIGGPSHGPESVVREVTTVATHPAERARITMPPGADGTPAVTAIEAFLRIEDRCVLIVCAGKGAARDACDGLLAKVARPLGEH